MINITMGADGIMDAKLPAELTDKQQHWVDYLSLYEAEPGIELSQFELVDLGDTLTLKHTGSASNVLSISKADGEMTRHDIDAVKTRLGVDNGKIKIKGDK